MYIRKKSTQRGYPCDSCQSPNQGTTKFDRAAGACNNLVSVINRQGSKLACLDAVTAVAPTIGGPFVFVYATDNSIAYLTLRLPCYIPQFALVHKNKFLTSRGGEEMLWLVRKG
jgi:hypothetical protein